MIYVIYFLLSESNNPIAEQFSFKMSVPMDCCNEIKTFTIIQPPDYSSPSIFDSDIISLGFRKPSLNYKLNDLSFVNFLGKLLY